jgi:hypothetical protein
MSKANISLLTLTVFATAALTNSRAVNQAGAVPALGALAFGITRSDAAIGDPTPVDVMGTAIAEAGADFPRDVPLMVGADGKLIAHDGDGDKHAVARSLEASAGDGAMVEVLLVPSSGLLVTAP